MLCKCVIQDEWAITCIVQRSWQIIIQIWRRKHHKAPDPASKVSNTLVIVAGAEVPLASCNCSRLHFSADMQDHLSKYLDNWIWAGSQGCHYNQWHCLQRHWKPTSSCIMDPDWEKSSSVNVFSAGFSWQKWGPVSQIILRKTHSVTERL